MSLVIRNLSKSFYDAESGRAAPVFENMSLTVPAGAFVSIIGPSGCGKTTLLRIIAGLEQAGSGTILISGAAPAEPWKKVGFVFQEYALFPWRRVVDNIAFGLEMAGAARAERHARAANLMSRFGLEGCETRYPRELSGGMKQRVAIARTMITDPDIILLDEPFGALDFQTRSRMRSFLLDVWRQSGKTILFITHSIDEAVYLSGKIVGLTRRPAACALEMDIGLPYPRDITAPEFNVYRNRILTFLEAQEPGA